MLKLSPYWKTVVASLAPVLATVQSVADDGALDLSDGLTIGAALLIITALVSIQVLRRHTLGRLLALESATLALAAGQRDGAHHPQVRRPGLRPRPGQWRRSSCPGRRPCS